MKKVLLGVAFMMLSGSVAMAQTNSATQTQTTPVPLVGTPAAAPIGPSIQFEEQKFDFGDINPGEVVEHTFRFTNNGTQPLVISNVRTTCGCTATNFPTEPVLPGATASITAKFNSAGKRGPQNKVITVESNAVQGNTQVMIVTNIVSANQ